MVARTLEVRDLRISRKTADKILDEHGIHEDQVRARIENVGQLPFAWKEDLPRGPRAYIVTEIDDEPVLVVLYPATDAYGTSWNLGSAYYPEDLEGERMDT